MADSVSSWSTSEALRHLRATFDMACKSDPGIMEPYIVMLLETTDPATETDIMRSGLRETVHARYGFRLTEAN